MNVLGGQFASLDLLLREQVEIASILEYLVSPFHPQFDDKVALFCTGIEWPVIKMFYVSQYNLIQRYMSHQKHYLRQCCGTPSNNCDDESVKSRYKIFTQFAQRWPTIERLDQFEKDLIDFDPLKSLSGIERAAAIKLVGGDPKIRKLDQALYRFDNKTFDQKGKRGRLYAKVGALLDPKKHLPLINDPLPHTQPRQLPNHVIHNTVSTNLAHRNCAAPSSSIHLNNDDQTTISGISSPSIIAVPTSSFERLSLSSSTTSTSLSGEETVASEQPSNDPSTKNSRRTAKQTNEDETVERERQLYRRVAFKAATVFVDAYKDGFLKCFSSVDQIISKVNGIFGKQNDLLILSQEVINAVKEGKINEAPPKKGRDYRLGQETMDLLSDLLFSHNALSQHNADGQLSRQQYISALQSIVGPKENMSWRYLNKEIEVINNYRQGINSTNPRQALRVEWFNTQNLIQHYENFEKEMVNLKCARWSTEEELEVSNEKIKWFDDQRVRVINGDEMSFGFDSDSNNLGGRPAMNYSADAVRDAGEADQHSSTKMTIFCAMTYNDEVLPPLIIFTATGYTKRLEAELLSRFHHIEGQWGHSRRRSFSPYLAASTKGSMSAEILQGYFLHISQLYPDMADIDKKRVIWKLDNGVGRDNAELNHLARTLGYIIYPGLPNTSEGTQECDQNFSTFKSKMEKNRQEIVSQNQSVSMFDLPFILFGGNYKSKNGNSVELVNAFESSFTVEHCRSARKKCGYCPSTRCALFHQKCRRVLGDNLEETNIFSSTRTNGELVDYLNHADDLALQGSQQNHGQNIYTTMMLNIEKMNASTCKKLIELGFSNAKLLKRTIKGNQQFQGEVNMNSIRTYPPGSRERQEQMRKARYPGEYFAITSGGAPNNCDDMLMSMQLNELSKDAQRLKKKKEEIVKRRKIVDAATEITTRPNCTKEKGPLTNAELKVCIQWKTNVSKPPRGKQNELKAQWMECKNNELPIEPSWTSKNEKRLHLAESGEIPNFRRSRRFKVAHANKCTYIKGQSEVLQRKDRLELLLSLYESLPDTEMKEDFKDRLKNIDDGVRMNYTCFEYNSDNDESDNESADDESDDNDDDISLLASPATNSSVDTLLEATELNMTALVENAGELSSEEMYEEEENCGCASGKYCRCPWDGSKFAHTCFECKKPVHSFCFGFNEEGGKSKCALCVSPNGVCEYSMNFCPARPDPLLLGEESISDDSNELFEFNETVIEESEAEKSNLILNDLLDEQSVQSEELEEIHPGAPNVLLGTNMSAQEDGSIISSPAELNEQLTTEETSIEKEETFDDHCDEDKENTQAKKFEEMNEDELRNEFSKRNMKVGRIRKKSTFITRLNQYDAN